MCRRFDPGSNHSIKSPVIARILESCGLFLRHATNRYDTAASQIAAEQAAGTMPKRVPVKGDFLRRRALLLPKKPATTNFSSCRRGRISAPQLSKRRSIRFERFFDNLLFLRPELVSVAS